ncbi:urease accessory protein UreF [Sinobacterium norvegicum]
MIVMIMGSKVIIMSTDSLARLKLMQLVSPALPVGAYAYSQGLEYAIDCGWLTCAEEVGDWLQGVMTHGLAFLDLPVLIRLHRAVQSGDQSAFSDWNDYLLASRETKELLLEDSQLGAALKRLLKSLNIGALSITGGEKELSFCSLFAVAGVDAGISVEALLEGFSFSWLENQVQAATKIVPLGQTEGQRLMVQLMPAITAAVTDALAMDDEQIGNSLTGVAMASSWHENQYSRLFRS